MQPGDCRSVLRVGEEVAGERGSRGAFITLGYFLKVCVLCLVKLHENLTREGGGDCHSHLRAAEW